MKARDDGMAVAIEKIPSATEDMTTQMSKVNAEALFQDTTSLSTEQRKSAKTTLPSDVPFDVAEVPQWSGHAEFADQDDNWLLRKRVAPIPCTQSSSRQ